MQGQRRIVLDIDFESALGETCRALRDEGLRITARIDVRDQFWRDLGCDFPQYCVLQAWSPELAYAALQDDPDAAAALMTTVAVYDTGAAQTAIVFAPGRTRGDRTGAAEREDPRIARVLDRLQHHGVPAAALS